MARGIDHPARAPRAECAPGTWAHAHRDLPRARGDRDPGRHIALYSHDTQGLGHVRRNMLLAAAIVDADESARVLLVSGAREAAALPLPERTSIAFVPELAKDRVGSYSARSSSCSLDHVVALRTAALERALTTWSPDLLVVDKVSRGFAGELEPTLRQLRIEHGTRTVLGLRDVLDDADTTREEWVRSRTPAAIDTLYDEVWVYGDPSIFDPAEEYAWSASVRAKVRYTGYLGSGRERLLGPGRQSGPQVAPAARSYQRAPYVLALVGGGQDGAAVAQAFAHAAYPPGHEGVLVTGPYLPAADLARVREVARGRDDLRVHRLVSDVPALSRGSAATVSMGGYNSVCEVVAARRPALVVPRELPRREQAVRADRFERHGLIDVLSLDDVGPRLVSQWLGDAVLRRSWARSPIDLDGLDAVPGLVDGLLGVDADGRVRHVG